MTNVLDHDELRESVRAFFAAHSASKNVRALMGTTPGYDPDVWSRLAKDLGVQGLLVPEESGGLGLGWRELGVVLEEAGAALLCAPLLMTGIATGALLAAGGDVAADLGAIASGACVATVAVRGLGHVPDGAAADLLLYEGDDGDVWLARSFTGEPLPTLDLTRPISRVTVDSASTTRLGDSALWAHTLDLARIALAAEQTGIARHCVAMSAEYAASRMQFGRPIGTFQAIKHMCADMLIAAELATSASRAALDAADADAHEAEGAARGSATDSDAEGAARGSATDSELPRAAALAAACCGQAAYDVTAKNIQVHGGIGFTWEHDAHLYFKRAAADRILLGTPATHRDRLGVLAGI